VREVVPQISEEKNRVDGIAVDTIADIAANKVCTLISRAEVKDYIDLYFLARAGHPLQDYVELARQKDAGVSRAMVGYLLSEFRLSKVPDFMITPVSVEELQKYFQSLAKKLAMESFPR
jgi:hypothetical protein